LAILSLLCLFAPTNPDWVERVYAARIYPFIAAIIVPVSGAIPFSVSLISLAIAPIALLVRYGFLWRKVRTAPKPKRVFALRTIAELVMLTMVVYLAFIALWGAGYRRPHLAERLELPEIEVNEAELRRVIEAMTARIEHDLPDDDARDRDRAFNALRESAMDTVTEWDGRAPTLPPRVKKTPKKLLLRFFVLGVNVPFFLEPHVDAGLTEPFFLAVATHELGHTAGINAESEADFMAWVAGLKANDPYARYALALDCYVDLVRHLPPDEQKAVAETLPKQAYRDLAEGFATIRDAEWDWLRSVNVPVYDMYLKSQGIAHGIQDYAYGVRLFLAAEQAGLIDLETYPDDEADE
jgi:hypothetical protein